MENPDSKSSQSSLDWDVDVTLSVVHRPGVGVLGGGELARQPAGDTVILSLLCQNILEREV